MPHRLKELNSYLRGWIHYFALGPRTLMSTLEEWVRRRLRMVYWRQWKRPRTRIRNLLALGVPRESAVPTGISSKGPWRMSRTPGIHQALNVEWFRRQGLVSISELWDGLSHLR